MATPVELASFLRKEAKEWDAIREHVVEMKQPVEEIDARIANFKEAADLLEKIPNAPAA